MVKTPDPKSLRDITEAIGRAERGSTGQIRVHLASFGADDVLTQAKKTFQRLKMHRTRERNAVLIYISFKNKSFAIVGDEGIHARVGDEFWNGARDILKEHFAKGLFAQGVVQAVANVGARLREHYPAADSRANELADTVTED